MSNFRFLVFLMFFSVLILNGVAQKQNAGKSMILQTDQSKTDKLSAIDWSVAFRSPPNQFRPMPFWHLNGSLTTGEIIKQMDAAKFNSGFGGVTVLPVSPGPQHPTGLPCPGMKPAFLSDEYFARYKDILQTAKKNDMQVILYDDIDFPSGMAGNQMKKLYPNDTRKELQKKDTLITGPLKVKIDIRDATLMSVVAMNTQTSERLNLREFVTDRKLLWDAPTGSWRVMFFYCAGNGDAKVDYMSPSAIEKYLPLTYGKYANHFAEYFGSTIKQVFYDDVGYVAMEKGWTGELNKKFIERVGKDPSLLYPALYEDIGSETSAARVAFFDTRAELLAEGYPRLIGDWSEKHGLKSSGHPPGNYQIQPVDMSFDIFKFYRHSHIPLLDYIFYHTHGRDGFKLVSSAADVYDRPVVAAEVCGAFLENEFDSLMLYRTAMDVFTRGVNFIIPHGMWYDYRPEAVRIPPLISSYSPKIGPSLPSYTNFVARSCFMLQGGKRVSDIAIFYPIVSLQAFFAFNSGKDWGANAPAEADYLKIGDILTRQIHRDFTFIHPETWVSDQCKLVREGIELKNAVNKQSFKVLILPGGKVISLAALKKIKAYYEQGGKLIATSMLPSQSSEFSHDKEVIELIKELFGLDPTNPMPSLNTEIKTNSKGGQLVFIPQPNADNLSAMFNSMNVLSDLNFETILYPVSGKGEISYIHKIKENRDIYYIANSSNDAINTFIELRGQKNPELWFPDNGKIIPVSNAVTVQHGKQIYTRFRLELQAVKSVFIVDMQRQTKKLPLKRNQTFSVPKTVK